MNKKKLIYGVIGLLAGLAIGYWATHSLNRNYAATTSESSEANAAEMPPGHPQTGAAGATGAPTATGAPANNAPADGAQADVLAIIQQARNEPANFDAQMKAAALFAQIQRHDQALEFYQKAQQAKPKDFDVLAALGSTNLELQRFPEAERWYKEALKLKPRQAEVLQNLVATLLAKGDKPAARAFFQQLEQSNPDNPALAQLRAQLN